MVNMLNNKNTKRIIIATVVVLAVAILVLLDIYKCPLDYIVGLPCPMCGMTRAFLAALSGDFAGAFYYHPLWIVIIIGTAFIVMYEMEFIKIPKTAFNVICIILGVLLLVCYIVRLIMHSDIVMPHFETSLIYRLFHLL